MPQPFTRCGLPVEGRVLARRGWAGEIVAILSLLQERGSSGDSEGNPTMLLSDIEYLNIGRCIVPLLGSALGGPSAEALRDLAHAHDPSADDSRISAEVFLFHKYLLMQACVGVFPEAHVDHVVGGLFAALNERANGLELGPDRQQAMEAVWQRRAGQFERSFSQDRVLFLDEGSGSAHWKQTISRFCQNVHEMADPPDIWSGNRWAIPPRQPIRYYRSRSDVASSRGDQSITFQRTGIEVSLTGIRLCGVQSTGSRSSRWRCGREHDRARLDRTTPCLSEIGL